MSYTKRQFVEAAFEELGLASYVFDLQSEQLQGALRRLDSMLATWDNEGIKLSYPLPSSPEDSDLDTETNIPDKANQAIILSLAILLAPGVGKQVSQDTKVEAHRAKKALYNIQPEERQYPSDLPVGAGYKTIPTEGGNFFENPDEPLTIGGKVLK